MVAPPRVRWRVKAVFSEAVFSFSLESRVRRAPWFVGTAACDGAVQGTKAVFSRMRQDVWAVGAGFRHGCAGRGWLKLTWADER